MTQVPQKAFRALTVLLAVCLLQVYVLASGTMPNASTGKSAPALNGLVLGRLIINESQSILVDGNNANSGTTIFSGARLQTPEDVDATIQLGSAGKLYIQPNSDLIVSFNNESIDVRLATGNAFVAASAGVKYSVTTPDGKTALSVGEPGDAPPPPPKPWSQWTKGEKVALGVGIGIGITVILYFALRDNSPSR
ncbi:MAG: hypothetical protein DMF68_08820 [Acidobacteria bacterium]|nr:MAG: hypothetical protein DMF68_08820 [Acidobacteriota bacterium]